MFLLLSCSAQQKGHSFQDKNILEVYESLPVSLFNNDGFEFKYELTERDGKWVTNSSADYEMPVVVDIQNGFIEISDEGTGGGSNLVQVVMFRKSDQNPCIGICLGGFNGMFSENNARFYEYINNRWTDVTGKVFPVFEFKSFMNTQYVESNLRENNDIYSVLDYWVRLPRFGLIVESEVNWEKIQAVLRENVNPENGETFDERQQELLRGMINNIMYEKIKIRWDKQNDRFMILEKVPVMAQQINDLLPASEPDAGMPFVEKMILDELWTLPEMKKLATYIDSVSSHTHNLKLIIEGLPDENEGCYAVKAAEDNGESMVMLEQFFIHPETHEIVVYDFINDEKLGLEEWRESGKFSLIGNPK